LVRPVRPGRFKLGKITPEEKNLTFWNLPEKCSLVFEQATRIENDLYLKGKRNCRSGFLAERPKQVSPGLWSALKAVLCRC